MTTTTIADQGGQQTPHRQTPKKPVDPRIPGVVTSRSDHKPRIVQMHDEPVPLGLWILFCGPVAAGKGTIMTALRDRIASRFSVSYTTRSPREGEVDGTHYHFVSEDDFRVLVRDGHFIEVAQSANDHWYGTPISPLIECFDSGGIMIGDVDLEGMRQIRGKAASLPNCVLVDIFYLPPGDTLDDQIVVLGRRIMTREGSTDGVAGRLARAAEEISAAHEFSHRIVSREGAVDQIVEEEILPLLRSFRPDLFPDPCAV